ncbi:Fungal specific transcription factor domain [Rhizoctonia solani]|uniref:Fungal specific transcription factor domain n=1 Tax=Rhizoctonia solani TaxID=456999 RepID=A0A8H7GZW4_9AGAM|nr:Fungal specific transcription factor domain [Rhizoctonia solani]
MDTNESQGVGETTRSGDNTPKPRGRACTECRSIKVKCENQHTMLDGPCARCTRLSLECVYQEKKRGRKPRHGNPYAVDGPSEIMLQHSMSPVDSAPSSSRLPIHSPAASASQTSSYVNSARHYGDARFEQEHSLRGLPVSPFTSITSPDVSSVRDSHPMQNTKTSPHFTIGAGTTVESSSGSGSATNASLDPDRSLKLMGSTKEPHPKDAPAGVYSLANILADSRPTSPINTTPITSLSHDTKPQDNYDTPVSMGFLQEAEVPELFRLYVAPFFIFLARFLILWGTIPSRYHEFLNPLIALLDPALHTPTYVRTRSSVLFTAILTVSCRFARPNVWENCNSLGQTLLGRALADGICSIEYVQALSLLTFWKDSRDSSSWRKVGLAIRMAYELNLHDPRTEPLSPDELLAREQLNKERTWLRYDMTTAMQRNKPQMVPNYSLPDAIEWLGDHPDFPCNADAMLVISSSFGGIRLLCHSLFSSMTTANKAAFEPLMRHVSNLLDERIKRWINTDQRINLAPVSRALLKFQSLNLKLLVAELKLLNLIQPQLTATRMQTLECIKCAMDVLRHVITELVPNGSIIYCQDMLAISCAYAGVWLFKQLPHVDEGLSNEIIDVFNGVSNACRALARQKGDTPSHFVQFFDHLVRNARSHTTLDASRQVHSAISVKTATGPGQVSASMPESVNRYVVPELIPPLEGMDYQWTNVMNGLNDWWRNFNYLGADAVKSDFAMGNPM